MRKDIYDFPVLWKQVIITNGFWKQKIKTNESVTLPAEYKQCKETGRIDSIKCIYDISKEKEYEYEETIDGKLIIKNDKEPGIPRPHHYWDSDVAKWIEAASYSLSNFPNTKMEKIIDGIVDDFEKLQQPDGYMNTYYTVVEPGRRWTNVYQMHELYCAGHLIEAAIAYYQATGKNKFLQIIEKYVDHIDSVFGPEDRKIHGYPGHQEIELALMKLYLVTKKEKYLNLAKYFLDERGEKPYFFEQEALKYGRDLEYGGPKGILGMHYLSTGPYSLFQSHLPVREQLNADGHAVRLTYMGTGMVDVGLDSGDDSLVQASIRLWKNVTNRRMYITGGVGAQQTSERFSFDYQLPNEESYNETCAAIGMAMWSYRLLQYNAKNEYGDILEKALYNGVISCVSLTGDKFFYANHLASEPKVFEDRIITNPRMFPNRQEWFAVSCCPMNLARTIESISGYMYTVNEKEICMHLFAESTAEIVVGKRCFTITQHNNYPWNGENSIHVISHQLDSYLTLKIRIPGWANHVSFMLNGSQIIPAVTNGYASISRNWKEDDVLNFDLHIEPFLVEANPNIRMDYGKVAIQYGPLIYCLEEIDNDHDIFEYSVSSDTKLEAHFEKDLLQGVVVIEGEMQKQSNQEWGEALYRRVGTTPKMETGHFKAIPYYAWSNRGNGRMTVWLNLQKRSIK